LNAVRGNLFEDAVRDALRTGRGGDLVSPKGVTTRPDLPVGQRFGVTDVKDVESLSQTKQLRAMADSADAANSPFNLIISSNTQTISVPLQQRISRFGGRIFEFDPATGTFKDVVTRGNKVVR
jgi:filamentous hemagglutinin